MESTELWVDECRQQTDKFKRCMIGKKVQEMGSHECRTPSLYSTNWLLHALRQ